MRSRSTIRYVAVIEGCLVAAASVVGLTLGPARASSPAPVTARVTACDVSSPGAAQVTYTVTNTDRTIHNYRVELTVVTDAAPLGWGISLVNRVKPGSTATARAMLPLTGSQARARCIARASTAGKSGHHD